MTIPSPLWNRRCMLNSFLMPSKWFQWVWPIPFPLIGSSMQSIHSKLDYRSLGLLKALLFRLAAITVRYQGSELTYLHKLRIRILDTDRKYFSTEAWKVERIEHDPNRSGKFALIRSNQEGLCKCQRHQTKWQNSFIWKEEDQLFVVLHLMPLVVDWRGRKWMMVYNIHSPANN